MLIPQSIDHYPPYLIINHIINHSDGTYGKLDNFMKPRFTVLPYETRAQKVALEQREMS